MMDRQTLQMLTTKLDQNAMKLREASDFVKANYNILSKARTRDAFLKEMAHFCQAAEQEPRDLIGCLVSEREGAFAFPMAADMPADEPEAAALDLTAEAMAEQQRAADAIANAQASEQNLPNGKVWVRKSSIEKPTKRVWDIADEMVRAAREAGQPMPSRKEVQDECVRRGIASGTARTQYQAWKKACDEAAANAAKAAALSAQFNRS